jgi:hypothetical protein
VDRLALNTDAPAVDDPDAAKAEAANFREIFLDYGFNITW